VARRGKIEVERGDLKGAKLQLRDAVYPDPGAHGPRFGQEGAVEARKLGHHAFAIFEVQLEGGAMGRSEVGMENDPSDGVGGPAACGLTEGDFVSAVHVVTGKVFQELGHVSDTELTKVADGGGPGAFEPSDRNRQLSEKHRGLTRESTGRLG
jgi:hypothetical protein